MHTIDLKLVNVHKSELKIHFLGEVSYAIDLNAEHDITHTNFNCKAEEITKIKKIKSKKSGGKNHR